MVVFENILNSQDRARHHVGLIKQVVYDRTVVSREPLRYRCIERIGVIATFRVGAIARIVNQFRHIHGLGKPLERLLRTGRNGDPLAIPRYIGIARRILGQTISLPRSEERSVGKECVRTCRYGWWPY